MKKSCSDVIRPFALEVDKGVCGDKNHRRLVGVVCGLVRRFLPLPGDLVGVLAAAEKFAAGGELLEAEACGLADAAVLAGDAANEVGDDLAAGVAGAVEHAVLLCVYLDCEHAETAVDYVQETAAVGRGGVLKALIDELNNR